MTKLIVYESFHEQEIFVVTKKEEKKMKKIYKDRDWDDFDRYELEEDQHLRIVPRMYTDF